MSLKEVYEMCNDASEELFEETKIGLNRFERLRREIASAEFKNKLFRLAENYQEAEEEATLQESAEKTEHVGE